LKQVNKINAPKTAGGRLLPVRLEVVVLRVVLNCIAKRSPQTIGFRSAAHGRVVAENPADGDGWSRRETFSGYAEAFMAAKRATAEAKAKDRAGNEGIRSVMTASPSLVVKILRLVPGSEGGSQPRLCENSRVQFACRKFFPIWSI